jgi:hypothetical protein
MRIEGDVPPHDGAALLGQFPRKRPVDAEEPIPNELIHPRFAECARAQAVIVSHESSHHRQAATRRMTLSESVFICVYL